MLDANYLRHLKVLGKWAKLFDVAAADVTTLDTLLSTTVDQYATGTTDSLPAILLFPTFTNRFSSAIGQGATALQQVAKDAAKAYLISADFREDFVTSTPATPSSVASVLTALAAEMTTDGKTFTTKTTTGFCLFFDSITETTTAFPQSGAPTYADSVYVVSTIV